jgi:hypothetical protein
MLTFKAKFLILLFVFGAFQASSQIAWNWTQKADMPFANANNAVSQGEMAGNSYIFSFGGIDSTKIYSGVNKRAFRYDVTNDVWDEIDTLPAILPLVASSANTVKNKIYIMGGYHVYSNGNETSSDEVIIYNPETNTYSPNGAPIPTSIDDQAQMVWRDSLIYVVSGWSNSGNVSDVQIYDPELDQWQVGTDVPTNNQYRAFGSSGYIIGDTIFYHGGASTGFNFPATKYLRKGVINSSDPTQITWSLEEDAPTANYRSACVAHGNNVFWIGGSSISYNYNGVAYNGSGGVEPSYTIARYDAQYQDWHEGTGAPFGLMDLRGIGQVSSTSWIICGGMEDGQQVSKRTFLLAYDPLVGGLINEEFEIKVIDYQVQNAAKFDELILLDLQGKFVEKISTEDGLMERRETGLYILNGMIEGKRVAMKLVIP